MRFIKLLFVFVIINFQSSIINCYAKGAGTTAGGTLLEPVSAKVAGMGEAYTAVSGEVASMHYNPAGIATLKNMEMSAMFQKGLDEDNIASILFGKNFPFGVLGISVLYYDTGKIEMFDTLGNEISKTGQKDMIVTISGARSLSNGKINAGVNVKAVSSEIFGEKATAFAVDLGTQYKEIIENIDVGLAVRNLGTELTYIDEGENLPMNIAIGALYTKAIDSNILKGSLDIPYYVNEEEILCLLGVEFTYNNSIAFRGGYRQNFSDSSSDDEQSLNFGVGFIWKNYSIDYAIGLTDNLSNPHHISINIKF